MANDNNREFSEREDLPVRDGADAFDVEERKPAWAQEMENRSAAREGGDPSREEAPAPEKPRQGRRAAEEPPAADAREAEAAWNREARKVEGRTARRGQPEEESPKKKKKSNKAPKKKKSGGDEKESFRKNLLIVVICSVLFIMVALMVVSNFVTGIPFLNGPRKVVTAIITPVQRLFAGVTDRVVEYLRTLKIRGNLEYEYDQLLIRLDELATEVAVNEELRRTNQALYDLLDEQQRNRSMNPVAATVIGTVGNNYFSTLTLDVGSANGVEEYMAVVAQGGLVGVTYDVDKYKCQVRCIIDSDCTVAGLVQSSRDQGSVKGTLGTNGEPMCRMYYLPDSALPRPGDVVVTSGVGLEFPKGIPIGYIRESTRGMEDNKSYVVLEPVVDFQHLEYVTVYRYRPTYAEAAQARVNAAANITLETLATARPIPEWELEGVSDFLRGQATATPDPKTTETPAETPAPTASPTPSATPDPDATAPPPNLEYVQADRSGVTATPSPRPTITPTPSPAPTPDPGALTVEDDE